jgi:response regulator RpfG family c-di-GMP phosphodiesterase
VTPVRLVVVDDHMVFREGLRALLGRVEDIEIVGEAATTQEAIDVTEAARPDVVLMDLHPPATAVKSRRRRSSPPTPRSRCSCSLCIPTTPTCAKRCTLAPVATYSRTPNRRPSFGRSLP